ncbi:hypothetical protein P3T37_000200 [Kitasatospora sp. MAA4]|uniref:hypothetical protein n=1 Tax=Kitasatospora sp. MAA4 TaxID=3035093 RepID=UPI002473C8E0|nr:hypothetical protein [Kitasatospora sp. MAA4]MDH6130833.1 hypothetical protein [Kitasatospora sp. MAA4]
MALGFVGIDPSTGGGGSPTVWVDDEAEEIIVQSWTADDALCEKIAGTEWVPGHALGISSHESVIRIPARMVPILKEAVERVERARLRRATEDRSEDGSSPGDA